MAKKTEGLAAKGSPPFCMRADAMRTTIVCGLLGSGKTTFIQHLLRGSEERVAVLVNDFGKAGIDGEVFSADGIESIELPSGCVCCTLKFDLITTLEKIIATKAPQHLVIEPSGIASPSGVIEALDLLGIRPVTVVGIVDATEFLELREAQVYGSFFEDQIRDSDIILVNKTDLVDQARTTETVELVEQINPRALIFRTINAVLHERLPAVGGRSKREAGSSRGAHFRFETISLWLKSPVGYVEIEALFDGMLGGRFGNVVRAKALIQTDRGPFRFDLSYGKVDAAPFRCPVSDNRLVMIGEGLKKENIPADFLRVTG